VGWRRRIIGSVERDGFVSAVRGRIDAAGGIFCGDPEGVTLRWEFEEFAEFFGDVSRRFLR